MRKRKIDKVIVKVKSFVRITGSVDLVLRSTNIHHLQSHLTTNYNMRLQTLLLPTVFHLSTLGGPAEVDAFGVLSFAAKSLTRFKMRLDARLRPNQDDVVNMTWVSDYRVSQGVWADSILR